MSDIGTCTSSCSSSRSMVHVGADGTQTIVANFNF